MTTFSNSRSYRLVSGYIHVNITDVHAQKKKKTKTSTKLFFKKKWVYARKVRSIHSCENAYRKQSYFSPRFFECVFFVVALFYFLKVLQCFKFAEKKIIILHKSFHPVLSSPLDKSKTFRVENISVFSISMYLQCLMSDPNLQGPLFLGPTITLF